jgi:hypothetical protein
VVTVGPLAVLGLDYLAGDWLAQHTAFWQNILTLTDFIAEQTG